MPAILTFRYKNGDRKSELEPVLLPSVVETLDQASGLLPDGAYTTFRTYPGYSALHLEDHFQRLEHSSRLAGYSLILDTDQVRLNVRQVLRHFSGDIARVRVVIPFNVQIPVVYIFVGALSVPTRGQYEQGVDVISRKFSRTQPDAKLTGFIASSRDLRKELVGGIEEIIMVDDQGKMLEGLSSNFFAVIDGEIHTADQGALPGITRQIVLETARDEGVQVRLLPPSLAQIDHFSEAFITSTSRAVLPVKSIDSRVIGSGTPGEITRRIMEKYNQRVMAEIQPI